MTGQLAIPFQWILGVLLILSASLVLYVRKPVHASLAFLLTLMLLAVYYLELSASFIAVMQILVYAGAIMVIFMFVIVLFQDAHQQIDRYPPQSSKFLLTLGGAAFLLPLAALGLNFYKGAQENTLPHTPNFGSAEALGKALYWDYFFPFEAIVLLFLVAMIGAFYIGRKDV